MKTLKLENINYNLINEAYPADVSGVWYQNATDEAGEAATLRIDMSDQQDDADADVLPWSDLSRWSVI